MSQQPRKQNRQRANQPPVVPEMGRFERVWAAVHGEEVDRPPVCFWQHMQPNGSGRKLAMATAEYFDESWDLDIAKIMPDMAYPFPANSIKKIEDWRQIELLDTIRSRYFLQHAEAVQAVKGMLGGELPVVATMFNPMEELWRIAGSWDIVLRHFNEDPAIMHETLHTIAENQRMLGRMFIESGADGVFFAIHGCTEAVMPETTYREFGRPYDLMTIQGMEGGWLNTLHIHGESKLHFDLALSYPVAVLSWADQLAGPSLRDARLKTTKTLMGGWNETGAIANGDRAKIRQEAEDAFKQTGGKKFILAPGCTLPDVVDERSLKAAREMADSLGR